jgi:hypothetical protein
MVPLVGDDIESENRRVFSFYILFSFFSVFKKKKEERMNG